MKIRFVLNGSEVTADVKGRDRLMDLLWRLGIRSVKEGCSTGDCGSCNVLVNGKVVNSCLMLAVQARNKSVVTVEGLSHDDRLHQIQEALIEYTASQCGYCIPGIVITAKYILDHYPNADEETVRRLLIANICRCGGYTRITDAVLSVIASQRR